MVQVSENSKLFRCRVESRAGLSLQHDPLPNFCKKSLGSHGHWGLILQAWAFRCAGWARIEGASRHPWLEIQPIETPAFEFKYCDLTGLV